MMCGLTRQSRVARRRVSGLFFEQDDFKQRGCVRLACVLPRTAARRGDAQNEKIGDLVNYRDVGFGAWPAAAKRRKPLRFSSLPGKSRAGDSLVSAVMMLWIRSS